MRPQAYFLLAFLFVQSVKMESLYVTMLPNETTDDFNSSVLTSYAASYNQLKAPLLAFSRYLVSWFVPFLFIFGVSGTSLCLVGLLRRRSTQTEIQPWFVALSIADLYALVLGLPHLYYQVLHYIFPGVRINYYNALSNPIHIMLLCYAENVLIYFGLLVSPWIQVGISVLRVCSARLPSSMRVYMTRRNSVIALITTIVASLGVSLLMILPNYKIDSPHSQKCILKKTNTFFYLSLFLKVLLPLFFLLSSSLFIIASLREFARTFSKDLTPDCVMLNVNGCATHVASHDGVVRRPHSGDPSSHSEAASSGAPPEGSHAALLATATAVTRPAVTNLQTLSALRSTVAAGMDKRQIQRRISYILLGMNASFVLLTLPCEVWKIYYAYFHENRTLASMIQNSTNDSEQVIKEYLEKMITVRIVDRTLNIVVYVNNATNWIFYFILGKQFRANIKRVVLHSSFLSCCGTRLRCKANACRKRLFCCLCCSKTTSRYRRRRHRHQHDVPTPAHYGAHQQVAFHLFNHRCNGAANNAPPAAAPKMGQQVQRCTPIYVPMRCYTHTHRHQSAGGKKPALMGANGPHGLPLEQRVLAGGGTHQDELGYQSPDGNRNTRRLRAASVPRIVRCQNELHFMKHCEPPAFFLNPGYDFLTEMT